MKLLIVTGLSGSGKSHALKALEDIGYYCIDNLPPRLLYNVSDLLVEVGKENKKIALTIDSRSKDVIFQLDDVFLHFKRNNVDFSTLYLECESGTLLKRYKETRRNHPLMVDSSINLELAISEEKEIMSKARVFADYLIDTSMLTSSQLKNRIVSLFSTNTEGQMMVNFVSFGFKFGILTDADLIFDVRCLPNPYYIDDLRALTGESQEVRDYVFSTDKAQGLLDRIISYLEYSIPLYEKEGKSQLVVGIGCTGGKHRSVTYVHHLSNHFRGKKLLLSSHRDILRL